MSLGYFSNHFLLISRTPMFISGTKGHISYNACIRIKYCFLNSFILFDWNGYDTFLCLNNRFGSVIKLMVWIHYGYGKEWRKFGCLLSYNAHSYTPKHYIKLLVFVVATTRRNAQQQQHDYYHYYYHLFIFLNCS